MKISQWASGLAVQGAYGGYSAKDWIWLVCAELSPFSPVTPDRLSCGHMPLVAQGSRQMFLPFLPPNWRVLQNSSLSLDLKKERKTRKRDSLKPMFTSEHVRQCDGMQGALDSGADVGLNPGSAIQAKSTTLRCLNFECWWLFSSQVTLTSFILSLIPHLLKS